MRRTALTPEQIAIRAGRITGTRAAMIMGESEFGGELEALREIEGYQDFTGSDVTDIGTMVEPAILQMYAHFNAATVEPGRTVVHPELDWLCASTDGYQIGPDGTRQLIVECKNIGPQREPFWGDPARREIPGDRIIQAVVQMACDRIDRLVFAVLFAGNRYVEYPLDRNLQLESDTIEVLHDWYRVHVLGDKVPEPWHRLYPSTVWPKDNGVIRPANTETMTIRAAERLKAIRIDEANIAVERKRAEVAIKTLIGEDAGIELEVDGRKAKLTHKWQNGARKLDSSLLLELARRLGATTADIDLCYTVGQPFRVLRVPRDWTKPTIELNRDEIPEDHHESNVA